MRIVQQTLLASAVRAASVDADFNTNGAEYVKIDFDWTTDGGGSLIASVQQFDQASGTFDEVLAAASVTAVGHQILMLGPTIVDETNLSANVLLAPEMRFHMADTGGNNQTYSVLATLYFLK